MGKIFNFYTINKNGDNVDRTWFDSSTIKYSECIDKSNELKTLKVTFNNGTQYEYKKINVNDYLLFRENVSTGKGLNKYIKLKEYEYEKIENADIDALSNELDFRLNDGIFIFYDDGKFTMKDNKDRIICEKNVTLSEASFNTICSALEAVGKQLYTEGKNFISDGEREEDRTLSECPF